MPNALGIDIYAGSFTLGVQRAGFSILGHVEHEPFYGAKTAHLNFPEMPIFDINTFHQQREFTQWQKKKVDLVYSNPPCASFSSARKSRAGLLKTQAWREDTRTDHILDGAEIAVVLNAKTYIWESITNAWKHGADFVHMITTYLVEHGYTVDVILQNNMYIGATQNRKRMFLVAHKYPLFLSPLTLQPQTTDELLHNVTTQPHELRWLDDARKALWVESIHFKGSFARAQRHLDETTGIDARIGTQSFLDYRLMGDIPPRVFMSDTTRTHPHEPRYFTWEEMKALCGLPPEWQSAETNMQKRALELSRAVLVDAGMWIATGVMKGLADKPLKKQHHWLIDLLDPWHPRYESRYVQ